ncbi:MAG TPA: alpha/beta hydrolase [Candidatus Saccharimonadia bacterium]|nr:alpha/beta hydrolase [Candidatus Saccharimonadia bacterium]
MRALITLLLMFAGAAGAQQAPTHPALPYAIVGGRALLLDLYVPAIRNSPRPTLIWVHGGGWSQGTRAAPAFATALLDRGIAVASIDYRLTSQAGQYGSEGVTFPAQIHDVKGAIRFLRANAGSYNLDPARFAVWGSSAGGHLAALAGTSGHAPEIEGAIGGNLHVSSRMQAVVDYYGPTDLLQVMPDTRTPPGSALNHDAADSPESRLLGYTASDEGIGVLRANIANPNAPFPTWLALARQASPITFVDAADPPFLIVHGTADATVPIRQSERLRDALAAVGRAPGYVTVPGAGHGGFPDTVQQQARDFIIAQLTAATIPVGDARGIAGAWHDPSLSGEGFEFLWLTGDTLAVTFYGHRDDGSNLFLIGTRRGALRYGETMTIDMIATRGGRYTAFDPAAIRREPWGRLELRLDACSRATATLEGADGRQVFALEKLAGLAATGCD